MAAAAEKVELKNVTLMWANLDTKNDMSGKYQVDLVNLTEENVEKAKALGLHVKSNPARPEKGFFLTPRSTFPIVPLDTSHNPLKAVVGNGTLANVLMSYYIPKRKPPGAPDRSPTILRLTITDLKEYTPQAGLSGSEEDL